MDILTYKLKDIKIIEISARTIRFKAEDILSLLKNAYFREFDCIILHRENLSEDFYLKSIILKNEVWKKQQKQVKIAIVGNHPEAIPGMEKSITNTDLPGGIFFADTALKAIEIIRIGQL